MTTTALLTDHYELTMVAAALADGTAHRRCPFEGVTRRLPRGRDHGVVAGTDRVIDAIERFRFDDDALAFLAQAGVVDGRALEYLAGFRFSGDVAGYDEGELFVPGSPVLTVDASFAEAVVLETVVLSILNFDSAVASAASLMVQAAAGRPIIEMGGRRTHEAAAVDAARAAYIAGFAATSNLEAGRRYGIPTTGTAAHAFVLLHDTEEAAFTSQLDLLGRSTTLLVDTFDIAGGIEAAVQAARALGHAGPGAVRIDSGDFLVETQRARAQLDSLGAADTRIVLSGDLDEQRIGSLVAAGAPVDGFGVGTSVVTGSGSPTAGFVYKVVAVDGRPVEKRSAGKATRGGRKTAWRVSVDGAGGRRPLQRPLLAGGERVGDAPSLDAAREHHRMALAERLHTTEEATIE